MNASELASILDTRCTRNKWRQTFRCFAVAAVWIATLLLLSVVPARSQEPRCTFSMSNISFGTIDVSSGAPFDAIGTFTYTCIGDSSSVVRISPSWDIGDFGSMQDGSGHKLMFNLYSDQSHASVWSTWFGRVKGPTIDVPIGRSERVLGNATVYAQIAGGQHSVPPGAYRDFLFARFRNLRVFERTEL